MKIDRDVADKTRCVMLVRRRMVTYQPNEQRARMSSLHDKYRGSRVVESSIDDFESHVHFPRELKLSLSIPDSKWRASTACTTISRSGQVRDKTIMTARKPIKRSSD